MRERVKELTALHRTARLLQNHLRQLPDLLKELVEFLPEAWQYPGVTAARIEFDGLVVSTSNFRRTEWRQAATFPVDNSKAGEIEICYLEARPTLAEGPFLAEERNLIDSLAEMLRAHLQHRQADESLVNARANLEQLVKDRTHELEQANITLREQVEEQRRAAAQIRQYQEQLQRLTLELSLSEARERREIAGDLHDHVGQALAFTKLRISQLQGNAVFCGFEDALGEVVALLDQTIGYTRSLTLEISPPVLYEFGLIAALEWLAERLARTHKLHVTVNSSAFPGTVPAEQAVVLFKSVKEILANTVRHADAKTATITVHGDDAQISITITDDGRGFDAPAVMASLARSGKFGLFSVRERMRLLGGDMTISSSVGKGAAICLTVPLAKVVRHE